MKAAALLLIVLAGAFAADDPDYDNYLLLPGSDLAGFGIDMRYSDLSHALRLPLVQWTYNDQKTYKYPILPDQKYKVPDQVFTRTVATTEAVNVVGTDAGTYQHSNALNVGLAIETDAHSAEYGPQQHMNNATGEITTAEGGDAVSAPPESGYLTNASGYLPSSVTTEKSSVLSIGLDFMWVNLNTENKDNTVCHHIQEFRLFQILLDNVVVRESMQREMDILNGKTWASDRDAFEGFFEKFGSHFVTSCVVGGAIEVVSLTSNLQKVTTNTITANLSVAYNSSSVDGSSSNTSASLVHDSDNCTNTELGYSYNQITQECEVPPEINCVAGFEHYTEDFDYADAWNTGSEDSFWLNGPNPWDSSGDGSSPVYTDPVHTEIAGAVSTRSNVLMVQTSAQAAAAIGNGIYTLTTHQEKNRDGALAPNPVMIEWYEYITEFPSTSYNDEASGSTLVGTLCGDYAGDANTDAAEDDKGIFCFAVNARKWAGDDDYYSADDNPWSNVGTATYTANLWAGNTPSLSFPVPKGAWFKVTIEIDWQNARVRPFITVNQNLGGQPLRALRGSGSDGWFPFIHAQAPSLDRITISNQDKPSQSYFDGIKTCYDVGGSNYAPVSTRQAIQSTEAVSKFSVGGTVDFGWEKNEDNHQIQTSMHTKIKGGDSSIVNLLDPNKKKDVFDDWKETISQNPVPIQYIVKPMYYLFPDEMGDNGVHRREAMKQAITEFLKIEITTDMIYEVNPDQPDPWELARRNGVEVDKMQEDATAGYAELSLDHLK